MLAPKGLSRGLGIGVSGWGLVKFSHPGQYAAILPGRILYLEEVDYPGEKNVRIALELSLDDAAGEPLWQRTLSSETQVRADEAAQIVEQLRLDFKRLVETAHSEIGTLLKEPIP